MGIGNLSQIVAMETVVFFAISVESILLES
jgi:hypothetical protein